MTTIYLSSSLIKISSKSKGSLRPTPTWMKWYSTSRYSSSTLPKSKKTWPSSLMLLSRLKHWSEDSWLARKLSACIKSTKIAKCAILRSKSKHWTARKARRMLSLPLRKRKNPKPKWLKRTKSRRKSKQRRLNGKVVVICKQSIKRWLKLLSQSGIRKQLSVQPAWNKKSLILSRTQLLIRSSLKHTATANHWKFAAQSNTSMRIAQSPSMCTPYSNSSNSRLKVWFQSLYSLSTPWVKSCS